MNIYIRTQGARIVREGRHLLVKKGEDTYHTLFVGKLRQVVLCGNIDLTPAALRMLLKNNIDTVFLTKNGRYVGRFATPESKNITLRKLQFTLLDDPRFTVAFVRALVAGKLSSMITLLMRIQRSRGCREAGQKAKKIRKLLPELEQADNVDSLRGFEGRGSAIYFQILKRGLLQDFGFSRRVRRPPTDPVNAVLSLLYTFLFNRVYASIRLVNLDPYPGFLHTPDYGRHSLVMDLMEEFRVPIADTLTLALFNLKILQKDDFCIEHVAPLPPATPAAMPDATKEPYGLISNAEADENFDLPPQRMHDEAVHAEEEENRGKPAVKLVGDAFQRVIENFERKMAAEVYYPPEDRQLSYNEILVGQAGRFRKLVEGSIRKYEPFLLK